MPTLRTQVRSVSVFQNFSGHRGCGGRKAEILRPLALNRKNALFAGSDEGGDNWAVIATLIENCKLSGINPHTWLTTTLTKLANGHHANAVGKLMPWIAVA